DVLEEHDPGRDLVRPVDVLRLLLVLAEVPGGVEELLRHDRRTQAYVFERVLGTGRPRLGPRLEVGPHRWRIQLGHAVVAQLADQAVVEGDQLHATPQARWAVRA